MRYLMKMAKCYQQLFCERSCVRSHPHVNGLLLQTSHLQAHEDSHIPLLREPFQFCAFSDAKKSDICDLLQGSYRREVNYFLGNLKIEMRNSENENIFYVKKYIYQKAFQIKKAITA